MKQKHEFYCWSCIEFLGFCNKCKEGMENFQTSVAFINKQGDVTKTACSNFYESSKSRTKRTLG